MGETPWEFDSPPEHTLLQLYLEALGLGFLERRETDGEDAVLHAGLGAVGVHFTYLLHTILARTQCDHTLLAAATPTLASLVSADADECVQGVRVRCRLRVP